MFENLTALYVEDEEQLRDVVYSLINKLFGKCFLASDGEEGLNIFIENQDNIDIIITDISMPKMNGLDMCKEIRKVNNNIPIIITTAHNDKDFLHKAIDVGISKFVTKPIDMHLLIDNIKKSLEHIILQQKLDEELIAYQEERILNAKFSATGQLAAGITHEINTPLTYIKANLEMLGYDVDDISNENLKNNMEDSLLKINDGVKRIETIVSSMKEISQQSLNVKENANIYSSVITSAILAYNKIKHISNVYLNGQKFNIDMDKNEFEFFATVELQRIEQVWIIIINNAMDELMKIDQFEDRRLDINITKDDNKIIIKFKDNAGGIKDEIVDHLFEPFKGTKKSSGMGVGLSIAKKIIDDQNDANIEAYNEDKGAVFKVTLTN